MNKIQKGMILIAILIIIFYIFIKVASASIIISPINISIKTNQDYSFQMNLTNTYNFDIFKLKFSNLQGFSFPEINITNSSTKTITFNVRTNYSYDGILTSKVSFRYLASIPEEIQTYNLTITSSGINNKPYNYITIRKGDTINFINKDSVTHHLKSTIFESDISPNSQYSYNFQTLGIFDYRTQIAGVTMFTGTIEVIDRTGKYLVYNQDYDFNYSFNLKSSPEATSLSLSSSQSNFSVNVNSIKEILLTISNNGDFPAELVKLSSDNNWATFDENNFNIPSHEVKFIKVKIIPNAYQTNQTNMSYNFNLNVKAINTENYQQNLNVFVNYHDFGSLNSDQDAINWWFNVFCPSHQDSIFCNSSLATQNNTPQIIYREPEISVNMSYEEWRNLVQTIAVMKDNIDRNTNTQNEKTDEAITISKTALSTSNATYQDVQEMKKINREKSVVYWVIGFVLIICGSIIALVISTRKLKKSESLLGVYDYRR